MNRDKREPEYPTELESQFILRLPEEPASTLREALKTGDNLKNRLTIQVENDMRHGEVRFDQWLMHAKIVDLPTITESMKTIDNKSFYKTADVAQMMICKYEPDQSFSEEEQPTKNKKKDPYKVDKKFLWPHGITPPTKNVRKRRFRKTLKKKFVEAPEIEKEVKRLLRADNEAVSVTWEVVKEEDDLTKPEVNTVKKVKPDKKSKQDRSVKRGANTSNVTKQESSNVVDIFGEVVSDSEPEEETAKVDGIENTVFPSFENMQLSDNTTMYGLNDLPSKKKSVPIEYDTHVFQVPKSVSSKRRPSHRRSETVVSSKFKSGGALPEEDKEYRHPNDMSKENMTLRIEQLKSEVDELKQRRQRTKHEIAGLENLALRQRFQDILHTLNQDIMFKEMEYHGLLTLQNSEVI